MFAFAGPAYLVSVGYMDPGNWATDLEGGATFGYELLWVLAASNAMAVLLQTLAARLGIVRGRDLAQACRETYPRFVTFCLWAVCEVAIVACDLAEVIGAAIGLKLLFHLPLLLGVGITACDTILILWFQRFGIRLVEAVVLALICVIGGCFAVEIALAQPQVGPLLAGLIPHLNSRNLYIAVAILGATVMPHNLYLHSALVQTRRIGTTEEERRTACRFNLLDSVVALSGAMFVNMAILVMAAAVFYTHHQPVKEIEDAYKLLAPILGTSAASIVFAIALICSGQSSTLTGTMAGQIVMEGFLNLRVRPWARRLITRMLAVTPAALTIYLAGEQATYQLIILSQVILSMQLPFAVIPLIHFTNDRQRMGVFANRLPVRALAWATAAVITGLNIWLAAQSVSNLAKDSPWGGLIRVTAVFVGGALLILLLWISLQPPFYNWRRRFSRGVLGTAVAPGSSLPALRYNRILVPLDHSPLDRLAIAHAVALGRSHGAHIFLLHVEEDVTSQVYGSLASTAEVQAGSEYLDEIVNSLGDSDLHVEKAVRFSSNPTKEIVNYAREIQPDLLVMGAHGHGRLKDLLFGNTIDPVRHALKLPILVVRYDAAS
ncbi:MAG: Mn2+/Fe2+ transporter, family [Bryobacterales bacterium]|nr:Mn2+/Fe2+ transporter, family [Bryobacterales bacterium]